MSNVSSLLVIRRDNIGDLVCTTPLVTALRMLFPSAWIGVLANSYNAPVLQGNPDIDQVYAYRKLKHLGPGMSVVSALATRTSMLWALRRKNLDLAIVATGEQDRRGLRLARLLSPDRIINSPAYSPGLHEVERTFLVARGLGFDGPIPPLRVVPVEAPTSETHAAMRRAELPRLRPLIGVHLSARRLAQRWPPEHFAALIIALSTKHGADTMLLWSPGKEDHLQHPGDDGKAATVMALIGDCARVIPYPTPTLTDLIGALSICDALICSDGGAMHIAAGLGKPVACMFGDSPPERWRPWGVRHTLLHPESRNVRDIRVEDVAQAGAGLVQDWSAKPNMP